MWAFLLSFASACPLEASPSYWEPDLGEFWKEETGRNTLDLKPLISMKWLKCSHAWQDHTAVIKQTLTTSLNPTQWYKGEIKNLLSLGNLQEIHSDFSVHIGSIHTLPRADSDPTLGLSSAKSSLELHPGEQLPRCTGWLVSLSICDGSKLGKWRNTLCHRGCTFDALLLMIKNTVSQTRLLLESHFQRS